jgi:gluconolactonase
MSELSTVVELRASARDSAFLAHDDEFAAVLGESPRLVRVAGTDAHEGPVYVPGEDALYFTTLPKKRDVPPGAPLVSIKRVALDGYRFPPGRGSVTTVREDANAANGMALGYEGRLVVCEQGSRSDHAAVTLFDPRSGAVEDLVDSWRGLRLNSPNDVVVRSDGTVWFTDPSYAFLQGFRPEPQVGDYVYRYDPMSGAMDVVADSLDKPNGLCFSPDESVLYVGDSGANQEPGSFYVDRPHHVLAYDLVEGGRRLAGERLFAVISPGFPDGIKVDSAGRVYVSSFSGVQVFGTTGSLIGEIRLPGTVNFTFGGPGRDVLFITTDDSIWAAVLGATGPPPLKGA